MSSVMEERVQVRLRPMREADVSGVLAVEESAYPYPWSEGIFQDCLRVGYCCWVWEEGEQVAGYGIMSVGAGEAHILNLCVGDGYRGNGLGRRMLTHLLQLARRHRAEAAFLEVRPSNAVAVELYESAGFHQVGERRNYYPAKGGREDALIMAIPLLDGDE